MTRILLGVLVGAALLAGCAPTSTPAHPSASSPSLQAPRPPVLIERIGLPTKLLVPAIDAESSLIETGMHDEAGKLVLEVSPVEQPEQASWWRDSPRPGMVGPAVILGHVNGDHRPGVFAGLARAQVGTIVTIERDDGTVVRFEVYKLERIDKDEFPFDRVFGDTTGPELRLITCGGQFIGGLQGYEDNIIAYAKLAESNTA